MPPDRNPNNFERRVVHSAAVVQSGMTQASQACNPGSNPGGRTKKCESREEKPMGVIITPDDIRNKDKIRKVARELGMDPEELEKLLKRGESVRRLE